MSYFNMEPSTDIVKSKSKEKKHNIYEFGSHFRYRDLYKSLINLVNILPSERLGSNGIYIQHDEKNSMKDLSYNNFLKERKFYLDKIKISIPKKKNLINNKSKIKFRNVKTKIQIKKNKDFSPFLKNKISPYKYSYLNYLNLKPKNKKEYYNNLNTNNNLHLLRSEEKKKMKLTFQFSFKNKKSNINFNSDNNSIFSTLNFSNDNFNQFFLPKIALTKNNKLKRNELFVYNNDITKSENYIYL